MKKEILRMDNVITEDAGKTNLNNFNLHMFSGEIMGLIGINEYGKEKLIELICQNTAIKFGTIYFMEKLVNNYKHSYGTENKVYFLNHTSKLVNDLTVIDNVFVLRKGFKKYVINQRVLDVQLEKLLDELGIHAASIAPRQLCGRLSEYERCVTEVLKAMVQGVKLIIVNNISNSLSAKDLQAFHNILFRLVKKEYSILYIGNHHEEVFKVCDRAALMNDGKIVKVFEKDEMLDENIKPYTIPFEDTKKSSLDRNIGECVVLYNKSNQAQKDILKVMRGKEWFSQIALIEENPIETMLFYHMSYLDNLCFLLDNKSIKINITSRIRESIRKEYYEELGSEIYETDIRKLNKISLYNLIYYRVHLLNPRAVYIVQPFSNADMYVRRHIIHLIRVLKRKGISVIILAVTISDSHYVADRLILIEGETTKEYPLYSIEPPLTSP